MAYSDLTFSKVKEAFQLTVDGKTNLFANTAKVQASKILTTLLQENLSFAIAVGTEKARSEFIIAQVLSDYISEVDKILGILLEPLRSASQLISV